MANTVNDVMNVIASPDYGIKNIAGTNQEILAILSGTHNSPNNIHVIVDDVKKLLQTLVGISTEKKPIKIESNTTKINHKNIKDILDETKGIRKDIDNLAKTIGKQGGNNMPVVANLDSKSSDKVASAMIENMGKDSGGLSSIINAFTKLKNVSLKDIIIGNQKVKLIGKVFKNAEKDLKINDKDLNAVIKLINAAPEMMKALNKIGWRVNKIIKNQTIEKINNILLVGENSLLSISKMLQKNEKSFTAANKVAKTTKELASSLNKTMVKLLLASTSSKMADKIGTKSLSSLIDKLADLSKKLIKNKKEFEKGEKTAKNVTVFIGNLLLTSILLTVAAVTTAPAIIGALLLNLMVRSVIPVLNLINKHRKKISKSISPTLIFVAFTGLMLIATNFLAEISSKGIQALLGSVLLLGIVAISVVMFNLLKKANKEILIGSLGMILMSTSLLLFGIALQKICDATKDVSWKQVGIIATMTLLLGSVVALLGIPGVTEVIALGAIAMAIVGAAYIPFGIALQKICDATKDVTWKQLAIITSSIIALSIAVTFAVGAVGGALGLLIMSPALILFGNALQKITETTKDVSFKQMSEVAGSIGILGLAVAAVGILSLGILAGSLALKSMSPALIIFGNALDKLSKSIENVNFLNVGLAAGSAVIISGAFAIAGIFSILIIPGSLAVAAMSLSLIIFGSSLAFISEACKDVSFWTVGKVSLSLALLGAAVALVGIFSLAIIPGAKAISIMNEPLIDFCKTLVEITKAGAEMSGWDTGWYCIGLLAIAKSVDEVGEMKSISNGAKSIMLINEPVIAFCKTLVEASKAGGLMGALDTGWFCKGLTNIAEAVDEVGEMKNISNGTKSIKKIVDGLTPFINMINTIYSFKKSPTSIINTILNALTTTKKFFTDNLLKNKDIENVKKYKKLIYTFIDIHKQLNTLIDIEIIPVNLLNSSFNNLSLIKNFFDSNRIDDEIINQANYYKHMLKIFCNNADYLKYITKDFTNTNFESTKLIIQSLTGIVTFLDEYSLDGLKLLRAHYTLTTLNRMCRTMKRISNINASKISFVGNTLSNTLAKVDSIDINKVKSVTNMFNAFSKINRTKSIVKEFTESVKEFTEACENLMVAMGNNTDAINNIDSFGINTQSTNTINENFIETNSNDNMTPKNNGIRIINVDEIAKTIAEKINGALSIEVPDSQVQLLINGTGGNEWTITRY